MDLNCFYSSIQQTRTLHVLVSKINWGPGESDSKREDKSIVCQKFLIALSSPSFKNQVFIKMDRFEVVGQWVTYHQHSSSKMIKYVAKSQIKDHFVNLCGWFIFFLLKSGVTSDVSIIFSVKICVQNNDSYPWRNTFSILYFKSYFSLFQQRNCLFFIVSFLLGCPAEEQLWSEQTRTDRHFTVAR